MTKAEAIAMLKRIQEPEAWEPQINQAAFEALDMAIKALKQMNSSESSEDVISRQAAIDALNGIINRFEQILRDIRESKVDDSVCGMCEYDGAFVGQSGDWCNECPGFEKDDCFRLSDECRKRWLESVELPAAQPDWLPDMLFVDTKTGEVLGKIHRGEGLEPLQKKAHSTDKED